MTAKTNTNNASNMPSLVNFPICSCCNDITLKDPQIVRGSYVSVDSDGYRIRGNSTLQHCSNSRCNANWMNGSPEMVTLYVRETGEGIDTYDGPISGWDYHTTYYEVVDEPNRAKETARRVKQTLSQMRRR